MKLLYTDTNPITPDSWERIMHSIITFGREIYLNENVIFHPKIDPVERAHYNGVFGELIEQNIIRLWNFEEFSKRSNNIIIPHSQSLELYDQINSRFIEFKFKESLGNKDTRGVELTSKLIQYKHELWNIGLANLLEVEGICYGTKGENDSIANISNYYKYERVFRAYTETLFEQLEINPVGFLKTQDIIELRKKSSVLSKQIKEIVDENLGEVIPTDKKIREDCLLIFKDIESEINTFIEEKTVKHFVKKKAIDTVISTIGTFIPVISFLPIVMSSVDKVKRHKKTQLFLFAMNVKKRASQSRLYFNGLKNE